MDTIFFLHQSHYRDAILLSNGPSVWLFVLNTFQKDWVSYSGAKHFLEFADPIDLRRAPFRSLAHRDKKDSH